MNINHIFSIYIPVFFARVTFHVGPATTSSMIAALDTAELIKTNGERVPLVDDVKEPIEKLLRRLAEHDESRKGFVYNFHSKAGLFCHIDSEDKDNESMTVPMISAISHECVHAAEDILRERHIHEDPHYSSECLAYLQSYLVKKVISELNKHVYKMKDAKKGEGNGAT